MFECTYRLSIPKSTVQENCNKTFAYSYFGIRPIEPASYPDVSLLMKMCAQRKAGRRQRLYPSHGPLRFITSHSFRARLCHAKNEAPEEEAAIERTLCTRREIGCIE